VEQRLGYQDATSLKLLGKELVEDILAWHIKVESQHGWSPHFWLEADHPTRVIKHVDGSDIVVSRYEGSSPIPVQILITNPKSSRRIEQTSAQFNVPIDPASFSLAGLAMPIGTDVSDNRIHRRIGYWTGNGLSEQL